MTSMQHGRGRPAIPERKRSKSIKQTLRRRTRVANTAAEAGRGEVNRDATGKRKKVKQAQAASRQVGVCEGQRVAAGREPEDRQLCAAGRKSSRHGAQAKGAQRAWRAEAVDAWGRCGRNGLTDWGLRRGGKAWGAGESRGQRQWESTRQKN